MIASVQSQLTRSESPSMAVYSGHDVTILAMLFALRSPLLKRAYENSAWWPPYACALVFEVSAPEGQDMLLYGIFILIRIQMKACVLDDG